MTEQGRLEEVVTVVGLRKRAQIIHKRTIGSTHDPTCDVYQKGTCYPTFRGDKNAYVHQNCTCLGMYMLTLASFAHNLHAHRVGSEPPVEALEALVLYEIHKTS